MGDSLSLPPAHQAAEWEAPNDSSRSRAGQRAGQSLSACFTSLLTCPENSDSPGREILSVQCFA